MNDQSQNHEEDILRSWRTNASAWSDAIANEQIESRTLVTNQAVIDAITRLAPETVLDIGCGEGWLVRALTDKNIIATGVDNCDALIEQAQNLGGENFYNLGYEDIVSNAIADKFDLVVCNFSLLGEDSVNTLLSAIPTLLNPAGHLVIQTLHPMTACGDESYEDGWRRGNWNGFGKEFTHPAPWYFRTMASWIECLENSGFALQQLKEPLHPGTGKPASVVFTGRIKIL